jgi:hypothetical protein
MYVAVHLSVPGRIKNLTVEEDSHSIELNWIKPVENGNCVVAYDIEWKAITEGSRSDSNVTENEFYVIKNLEACVKYEVSVRARNSYNNTSDAEMMNVTTRPDGKLLLMCWSMAY